MCNKEEMNVNATENPRRSIDEMTLPGDIWDFFEDIGTLMMEAYAADGEQENFHAVYLYRASLRCREMADKILDEAAQEVEGWALMAPRAAALSRLSLMNETFENHKN